jgi:hypothetical protein
MEKITKLTNAYLEILDISQETAVENAQYIFACVIAKDEHDVMYMGESMEPLVKVVEYIQNPEKTDEYIAFVEKFGTEPAWAQDNDFGLQGIMLPYLAPTPAEHADAHVYYAAVSQTGYKNQEDKEALMVSKLVHVEDFKKK